MFLISQVLYVCVYYFRDIRKIKSKNMKIKPSTTSAYDEDGEREAGFTLLSKTKKKKVEKYRRISTQGIRN